MAELPPHLRRLEAEAIHIMREVVAEFRNPVMLYSIGKDSSAMLHVAMKAFYPAPLPFPLLHVDTTWKFREMIAFRDETARRLGLDLRRPHQPGRRGARHFAVRLGSAAAHPGDEDRGAAPGARRRPVRRGLRRRAARRGEEPRQGAHLLAPLRRARLGPAQPAARTLAPLQHAHPRRANRCASSRCRTGPSSTSGNTSAPRTFPSCRSISPRSVRWSSATAR